MYNKMAANAQMTKFGMGTSSATTTDTPGYVSMEDEDTTWNTKTIFCAHEEKVFDQDFGYDSKKSQLTWSQADHEVEIQPDQESDASNISNREESTLIFWGFRNAKLWASRFSTRLKNFLKRATSIRGYTANASISEDQFDLRQYISKFCENLPRDMVNPDCVSVYNAMELYRDFGIPEKIIQDRRLFRLLDVNESGMIEADDLKSVLAYLLSRKEDRFLEDWLSRYDRLGRKSMDMSSFLNVLDNVKHQNKVLRFTSQLSNLN
ncbi:hypothetical protein Ciccas_009143 [Cichlidogyrus casuarinus]|uniref:EF-hand domain-containing protein n=1 Tax=Cichlidogyrus casuarinus TaxID=1844966 RepID=A0ABD2PYK8_9PLAT